MGCACAKERSEMEEGLPPAHLSEPVSPAKTRMPHSSTPRRRSALVTNTPAPEVIRRLQEPFSATYIVSELISEDTTSQLTRACHKHLNQPCFVKTIPKESGRNLMLQKERLLMNAERLLQLDHPHILRVHEVIQDERNFYLVTEPFTPIDLSDVRLRSEDFLAQVMFQVFWALNYCHHQGILHGKLSLLSLVWQDSGDKQCVKVKLTGFGELDAVHNSDYSRFAAPDPPEEFSPKADIWSCGMLLYTLLSGQPPFSELHHIGPRSKKFTLTFPPESWENYSQEVVSLIASMIEVNSKARLTAAQCRAHPWITRHVKVASLKNNMKMLFALRKTHHINPFQSTIARFVVMRILPEVELQPLEEAFSALDRDGDGVIIAKELLQDFLRVMPESDAIASAKKVIESGNHGERGSLSYTDFLVAVLGEKRLLCASNLRTVFSCFERGSSKSVSLQELRSFFFARTSPQLELQWRRLLLQVECPGEDLINFGTFSAMLASSGFS